MLVDWEIEADAREQLIRTVQQHEISRTLRIAVVDVANVRGKVDVFAKASVNDTNQTEVADITTRASATLHLIEAREIITLVWIPTIEGDQTYTERIVRTGEAELPAHYEVGEAALAIEPVDERRIRQVSRRHCERERYPNRQRQISCRKNRGCQHDAWQNASYR